MIVPGVANCVYEHGIGQKKPASKFSYKSCVLYNEDYINPYCVGGVYACRLPDL